MISNPILPGFNPDPSICRVGDDFYIATSTFEWYPGVQIHHSRDLRHWRLAGRPLARPSLLSMAGNPDSGGIWAPCLSHADGRFWLVYTDVKHHVGAFKDTPNYLTTAERIEGPWSEPVALNSSGFDASLFHDDDGRKWLLNQIWDHRPGHNRFAGIALQEYDAVSGRLVGPIRNIFRGTPLGCTEGPHLYRWQGRYYLLTAEGGTGVNHAVTMARSDCIEGPYEVDPANPILTSRDRPDLALQKAGHASVIETRQGEWYLVHLCGRPIGPKARCILGRETALQRLAWTSDGWLRLADGGNTPAESVAAPDLPEHPWPAEPERYDFDDGRIPDCFQAPRIPIEPSWCDATARPGHLRLRGQQSPCSRFRQSVLARRIDSFRCQAECRIEARPEDFQQMAGLMACYDTATWYYLRLTAGDDGQLQLGINYNDDGEYGEQAEQITVVAGTALDLGLDLDGEVLRFRWRYAGETTWRPIGGDLDATRLSDEYIRGQEWNFTGAFVGVACHDISGRQMICDVDWFRYV